MSMRNNRGGALFVLRYTGYRRCPLHNVGHFSFPVRNDTNGDSHFVGKVQHLPVRLRMKFPLTKTLNDFLESLDNFVHVRSLSWFILNHVINAWFHKFETFMSTYVGDDGVSLRPGVRK